MPRPKIKIGDSVRFIQGTAWAYGTVAQAVDHDMFTVTLADGSSTTRDRSDLQVTTWPRDPDKTWPADQDCTHCPGQVGGQHKFGCAIGGARQIKLSAVQDPNGKFRVV